MPREGTNGTHVLPVVAGTIAAPAVTRPSPETPQRGRPPLPTDAKAYLTVDCRFPEPLKEMLEKHAARTGVTAQDVIREILLRYVASLGTEPAQESANAIRVRLPERLYDPLCEQALRTGVTMRGLVRAIVLRHLASARW
jgi:predicted DNA-binding protein